MDSCQDPSTAITKANSDTRRGTNVTLRASILGMKNRCAAVRLVALTLGSNDSAYAQVAGGQLVDVDVGMTFAAVQQYSPADRFDSEQLEVPGIYPWPRNIV